MRYPGVTLDAEAAERWRVRAWMREVYAGPLATAVLDTAYVFELISETIDASRSAGHRTDRMTALIPVSVHRVWCVDLVTLPDPFGWPTLDGVSVRADEWLEPPDDWKEGASALGPSEDVVEVWARNLHVPVLKRYCIGPAKESIEPIYSRLRMDGWTVDIAFHAPRRGLRDVSHRSAMVSRWRSA